MLELQLEFNEKLIIETSHQLIGDFKTDAIYAIL